ncbi:uncharacterized protein BKA55DRAFT_557328 [Fusarium redolens]|uniref:Uncharacterized protein n=1 Tax=Fusarium redolens TaxID=48865 RepID=A0A9P9KPQ4_FUSRE|nr:uncharacterized protein BKA55DRAFT_557328 [Fusarium redolens]KAH7264914.1 hypothetical protein BKA55DRAFT_557328 [Fusarium redolens]
MAPQTRAKRRLNNTPTLPPSVEAASDDVRPLSNGDNLNDNGHPADDPQSKERETYSALVLGKEMLVPRTYDPDTYDPDARMPWTPEPEPYDPETYSAWGKKHFGEEWYQLRKAMIEERIPYDKYEPVYLERQRALRVIEHKVEGRPFKPYTQFGGENLKDQGWKRLWARISNNELGVPSSPSPSPPSLPPPPPSDSDSDLSAESREPTPVPADPWEQLEYKRTHWALTEEQYLFERFFLKEGIIDRARSRRENEPGNRQAREKRELMESFRYVDPPRFYLEQDNIQDHIDLPKKGWTREEIVATYEAHVAILEWKRKNSPPRGSGDFGENITPEEEAASASWHQEFHDAWNRFYGSHPPELPEHTKNYGVWDRWRKGTYARISRQRQREALLSDTTGDAASRAEELQRIEDEERRDREALERAIKRSTELTEKAERTRRLPPPQTQEEMNHRFRVWDELDVPLKHQNNRAREYGFGERTAGREVPQPPATAPRAGAIGDAPGTHMHGFNERSTEREAVAQSSATTPQPAKDTLCKTYGGRITKNTLTHAEASPRTAPQRHNRQRKTYKKERASRRLAKMEPEYGMLEDARGC